MFSLTNLLWLVLLGTAGLYLWRSGQFKGRARSIAVNHCKQLNLQLLDDSMVITGLWPVRSAAGSLVFRRRYRFEFASVGDRRYQGELTMIGMRLLNIELETYKLPSAD
ncbi:MAG: DUF3301 domain-containing protein [Gammaproteobacteria bacterium]|jgi:hypothetical protein|nr:DUF3301 domain-containing protein [Gammaproteobacteria bacterium]